MTKKDERIAELEAEVRFLRDVVAAQARQGRTVVVHPPPVLRPYYPPYWWQGGAVLQPHVINPIITYGVAGQSAAQSTAGLMPRMLHAASSG